ncbi:Histidinol-phosphate aminotransferase [Cladobotryum mycophilum]|uniref:histidinol-phosphate transaminase n=1 Tax=Cladobotryum mycophilum TaxID=491253 RepID=A0ABR0SZ77_9HYPO
MARRVDLEALIRPNILAMKGPLINVPAYPNHIQPQPKSILDRNENNLGSCLSRNDEFYSGGSTIDDLSAPIDKALLAAESQNLHRYPAPSGWQLKQQVAAFRGLPDSYMRSITLGNGSAELIDLLVRTTCVPGKDAMLLTPPTFPLYNDRAAVNDVAVFESKLRFVNDDFHIHVPEILELLAQNENIKLVFLPTPGNPTGSMIPLQQIEELLKSPVLKALVVVDEAYIDFAPGHSQSAVTLLDKYPNLVVLQTLSKSHGLAGLRFGMAFAHEFITEMLHRVQIPFTIPTPVAALANKALSPAFQQGYKASVAKFVECREKLVDDLQTPELVSLKVGPPIGGSHGNFVVLPVFSSEAATPIRDNARAMWARDLLRAEFDTSVGFIGGLEGCEGCLRITVGSAEENGKLVQDLLTVFGKR